MFAECSVHDRIWRRRVDLMGRGVTDSVVSPEPEWAEDLEEDLVQGVWLRLQMCDRSAVGNPAAFLATTTTRLAINALQGRVSRRPVVDVVRVAKFLTAISTWF
jgi:DNA-directed RNA polymerase specialized sigma24 family protein